MMPLGTSVVSEMGRSTDYQRGKKVFFIGNLLFDIFLLNAVFFSGASLLIKSIASEVSITPIILNGIYLVVFFAVFWIIHLPLHFYEGYIWEHRFKLSNQSIGGWFLDQWKQCFVGLVLGIILAEGVYLLIDAFPRNWWIFAGFFWLLMTFVIARVTPSLIVPLFFKYKPVGDEALKAGIRQLFDKCRVSLKDIYAVDFSSKTNKANAFFCGIGNNRRVVLSDTLISGFTAPEIETVVAHEIGHYKNYDIFRFLMVQTAFAFTGFYLIHTILQNTARQFGLSGIDDIEFFPMILLGFIYFSLVLTPLVNSYSRRREREADRFALEMVRQKEPFISVMRKLGVMNLAEMQPDKLTEIFLYDHPPLAQRIAFAENYKFTS